MKAEGPILSRVIWADAWSAGIEILTIKEIEERHKPSIMETIGWVIKEDLDGLSIANERCLDLGDECYRGHTFIPSQLIKSVTPFKAPRTRHAKQTPCLSPDALV